MDMTTLRYRIMLPVALTSVVTLSGCFDNDYDLSDIDTTARINVTDLVLPVRIDKITLGDVINLKDDSRIVERDGQYVLIEDGTFTSEPITINAIDVAAPAIAPINVAIDMPAIGGRAAALTLPIGNHTQTFDYTAYGVSECIKSINRVTTEFTIRLTISLTDNGSPMGGISFSDLNLKLPAGLQGTPSIGSYDIDTGVASLGAVDTSNGKFDFTMAVSAIDASKAHISFSPDTRILTFADELGIASGTVALNATTLPTSPRLSIEFNLSRLKVTSFSGTLSYDIDGMDIDPVSLGDLPSVLAQPETNIALNNPQIYLSLNNPLGSYGLTAHAGLTITPWRNGSEGTAYGLDRGSFTIGTGTGAGHICAFCMSPEQPASYIAGFENASFEPYSGLRDILRGQGLPDQLAVRITNPGINQQVNALPIGTDFGSVQGNYSLYAPLALSTGSKIVYSDTEAGWNDEDVDKITISTLEVTATVTNNLPVAVHMSGYPIDKDGNRINGVEIEGADIAAGAAATPLTIRITGTVTHLDGVTFTATMLAADPNTAIGPNQFIQLTDIRAKVSGHYEREL